MNENSRSKFKLGTHVKIVQKQHQLSGELTEGIVSEILTKSASHPHGIKVRLQGGIIGRIKKVLDDET